MASKVLYTSPFGTVSSEMEQRQTYDSAPDEQESMLQVQDDAHALEQSDSYMTEEKTLDEKEAEYKQKMGRESSGKSDLEEEREQKKIQVDASVEEFEKNKAQEAAKRERHANIQKVTAASRKQRDIMMARENTYKNQMSAAKSAKESKSLTADYVAKQRATMYANNSLTNLMSMSINDAMINSGRKEAEDSDRPSTMREMVFGQDSQGRQRTILVNGAMVTLDEDLAEEIQRQRSPFIMGTKKLTPNGTVMTDEDAKAMASAAKEIENLEATGDATADDVKIKDSYEASLDSAVIVDSNQEVLDFEDTGRIGSDKSPEELEQERQEQLEIERQEQEQFEAERQKQEEELTRQKELDEEAEKQRQAEKEKREAEIREKEAQAAAREMELDRKALEAERERMREFEEMQRSLQRDRERMQEAYDAPQRQFQTQYAYDDGYTYQNQQERQADTRKQRALPAVAVGLISFEVLLHNGRKLPKAYADYVLEQKQLQREAEGPSL